MQILAHITGPTGSGKTTIGEILQIKYPHLKIIELDNVYRQVLKKYNLEKDELNNIKKKILLELQKLTNNNIVITGNNVISSKKDFSDAIYYKINAKYKYFIHINKNKILKRRFKRHIEFISKNLDKYYNKGIKKGSLIIDFELWKKKINAPYKTKFYKNYNYKFMNNKDIIKELNTLF